MISAVEALQLPTAQLTAEEALAADKLESLIDEHIRTGMCHSGVDLQVTMTNANVIACVNQRLRANGWGTGWQPVIEQHRLNVAVQKHVGFKVSLFPDDEAYKEAARRALS